MCLPFNVLPHRDHSGHQIRKVYCRHGERRRRLWGHAKTMRDPTLVGGGVETIRTGADGAPARVSTQRLTLAVTETPKPPRINHPSDGALEHPQLHTPPTLRTPVILALSSASTPVPPSPTCSTTKMGGCRGDSESPPGAPAIYEGEAHTRNIHRYVALASLRRICHRRGVITCGSVKLDGYRKVAIGQRNLDVNRLVCQAFHGEPRPAGVETNHQDVIKGNNRPSILEWTTVKGNAVQACQKRLVPNAMIGLVGHSVLARRMSRGDDG